MVLVLSPNSGRSRHRRTSTHAPAPQPTEKINKPQRAAAGAPGPSPAPPRGSHAAPSAGTSLPPSAHGRALSAPHRGPQTRSLPPSARRDAPGPVSARRPLAGPPRDPCSVRARPCPRHLTQRSPNAQCGRPGSRGAAVAAAGGGGRGGPGRRRGRPGEYAKGGPPHGGSAPASLRQWWRPGRAAPGASARQLGTRLEATGPAGRSHWAECAGGPLLRKALGAQLGGGGERPAPTPGPGAPAVPAPPETPRGPGQGATAVAGPPSDRCRRPLPAAGIALPPGKPGAQKFLEQQPDSLFFSVAGFETASLPEFGLSQPCFFLVCTLRE